MIKTVARSIAAIVIGYVVFVALAAVAQEVVLGGVSYLRSSLATIAAAAILTPAGAALGAMVTVALAPARPYLHLLPMGALIVAETSYLYATGRVDGPLWFEAAAGLSLIVGALAGAALYLQFVQRGSGAIAGN